MSLPDSRNETYIPGTTPVSGATMNALQDNEVDLWLALRGNDYFLADDFAGPTLDASKWTTPAGAPTMSSDTGAFGYGAVSLSTSSATSVIVTMNAIGNGAKDFRVAYRARVSAMGGAGSSAQLAIIAPAGAGALFIAANGNANWQASHDFVTPGVFVNTDLGVAYGTTAHDLIEIRRTSGSYQWFVNGVLKLTAAPSSIPSSTTTAIQLTAVRAVSGTTTMLVDFAKLWARR